MSHYISYYQKIKILFKWNILKICPLQSKAVVTKISIIKWTKQIQNNFIKDQIVKTIQLTILNLSIRIKNKSLLSIMKILYNFSISKELESNL
jgi:hypothetical protein